MLERTLKRVKLKGKTSPIIREQYLRDDINCFSPLCQICNSDEDSKQGLHLDCTHYAVLSYDVADKYLEIFETPEIKGLIILQSVASRLLQNIGRRHFEKSLSISKDARRGCAAFLNEICKQTYIPRLPSDSVEIWLAKCCISVAEFYTNHLKQSIPVIIVTENPDAYKPLLTDTSIQVHTLKNYLEKSWSNVPSALQLYESITTALLAENEISSSKLFEGYLTTEALESGIKSGQYFKGFLNVNKHNVSQEAFVASSRSFAKDIGDIFICGMKDRNRSIHGDEVVVLLLPKHQWKSRSLHLVENPVNTNGETAESVPDSASGVMPTGKVVGIWERRWRSYVCSLPDDEQEAGNSSRQNIERLLVIPYDYRIPKIRIATKQGDAFRNQRILVRIDKWDKDSQYPSGHFVKCLGEIGLLETEVQSLLTEHSIFIGNFPNCLASELPTISEENPWKIEETELENRKDLRNSHLVFSIDPKGCEDVDDTLSVRELPGGHLELGVHIADVTHFVRPMSMVDLEARSRSTSVYLPDRRYDMLPHILSGELCSLLGNEDRYAVSVLWTLDSKCKVKSVWYGRTVLRSRYKLFYEAAQDILSGCSAKEIANDISEFDGLNEEDLNSRFEELKSSLLQLFQISSVLRNDRLNAGGLELNSINMKFEIDKTLPSVVSNIKSAVELDIHKTVAECMIFANHWVGKKILEAFPHQAVLRRHPIPRDSDLVELKKLASSKGFSLNIHSNKELATSLELATDNDDPNVNKILRILATHAMNQATYFCTANFSASDFYHYGLGLETYTHFTSPIRRYADILVHRLLLTSIDKTNEKVVEKTSEMEALCEHMNFKHKAAQDVEKAAQDLYQAFYFEELSSQNASSPLLADGIVYSLRTNGVLVFIPTYGLKGAVCLCNKEKKVALVNGKSVEWVDGKLESQETRLVVKTVDCLQKYNIFDHITLNIKVLKSKCHPPKIVLELVKNKPYVSQHVPSQKSDIPKSALESPYCQTSDDYVKDPNYEAVEDSISSKRRKSRKGKKHIEEEFDLYLFLQDFKALTLRAKN